jgi:hypothetical protein
MFEMAFSARSVPKGYITRAQAELQSFVSHSVKGKVGGCCGMTASLGVNQLGYSPNSKNASAEAE